MPSRRSSRVRSSSTSCCALRSSRLCPFAQSDAELSVCALYGDPPIANERRERHCGFDLPRAALHGVRIRVGPEHVPAICGRNLATRGETGRQPGEPAHHGAALGVSVPRVPGFRGAARRSPELLSADATTTPKGRKRASLPALRDAGGGTRTRTPPEGHPLLRRARLTCSATPARRSVGKAAMRLRVGASFRGCAPDP